MTEEIINFSVTIQEPISFSASIVPISFSCSLVDTFSFNAEFNERVLNYYLYKLWEFDGQTLNDLDSLTLSEMTYQIVP